jgi:hypothetical protein
MLFSLGGRPEFDELEDEWFAIATRWGIPVAIKMWRWKFVAQRRLGTYTPEWRVFPLTSGYMLSLGRLQLFLEQLPKRAEVEARRREALATLERGGDDESGSRA